MSQENVEIARRSNEVLANSDWSRLSEVLDPDVVLDLSRNVFNPGVYRGYDGFRRWLASVDEMWEDFRVEVQEYIDAGDKLVVDNRISGSGRESGVDVDMRVFGIWTFREGRVLRIVGGYRDRAEALEAAGLAE